MVRPILLVSFAVILPVSVNAQGRMIPTASHSVAVAPRAVPSAGQTMVTRVMPAARVAVRTGTPRVRASAPSVARSGRRHAGMWQDGLREGTTTDFVPVPGLGFDMAHLAATRGPEAVGAGPARLAEAPHGDEAAGLDGEGFRPRRAGIDRVDLGVEDDEIWPAQAALDRGEQIVDGGLHGGVAAIGPPARFLRTRKTPARR